MLNREDSELCVRYACLLIFVTALFRVTLRVYLLIVLWMYISLRTPVWQTRFVPQSSDLLYVSSWNAFKQLDDLPDVGSSIRNAQATVHVKSSSWRAPKVPYGYHNGADRHLRGPSSIEAAEVCHQVS